MKQTYPQMQTVNDLEFLASLKIFFLLTKEYLIGDVHSANHMEEQILSVMNTAMEGKSLKLSLNQGKFFGQQKRLIK